MDSEKLAKFEELQKRIGYAFTELHFIDEELKEKPDDVKLNQKRNFMYQRWLQVKEELERLEGKHGK